MGLITRQRTRRGAVAAVSAALLVACTPATGDEAGVVWALGDSQGSPSPDPDRGLPWTERLGPEVFNGAISMQGAGYVRPGTISNRTVVEQASLLATSNHIDEFIVMAGVNDIRTQTVHAMLGEVRELEAIAAAEGATVIYVGIVPLPEASYLARQDSKRLEFNARLASLYPSRFIDCADSMADSKGWLRLTMSLSPSDLHLNDAGERALASCIAAARPDRNG